MSLLAFVLTFTLSISACFATEEVHLTSILGSNMELSCSSSFPPAWNKIGPNMGDFHVIGANGKRYPNWNDQRYSFHAKKSEYFLQISDVELKDAGKFVCGSDSPKNFILAVLR